VGYLKKRKKKFKANVQKQPSALLGIAVVVGESCVCIERLRGSCRCVARISPAPSLIRTVARGNTDYHFQPCARLELARENESNIETDDYAHYMCYMMDNDERSTLMMSCVCRGRRAWEKLERSVTMLTEQIGRGRPMTTEERLVVLAKPDRLQREHLKRFSLQRCMSKYGCQLSNLGRTL